MPETIGTRVQSITLEDGTVLDKNDNETKLMLVASAYEIGGGDSYWMLGALNEAEDLAGSQYIPEIATPAGNYGDAVTDYVNAVYGGQLPADAYPLASGRLTRVTDPYPVSYTHLTACLRRAFLRPKAPRSDLSDAVDLKTWSCAFLPEKTDKKAFSVNGKR